MSNEQSKKNKGRKPAANHPWKNTTPSKALKWAREETNYGYVNNYKVGGGHKLWNGR